MLHNEPSFIFFIILLETKAIPSLPFSSLIKHFINEPDGIFLNLKGLILISLG